MNDLMNIKLDFGIILDTNLVKVIKSSVQVGMHPCRRFICDLDSIFQNALKMNVYQ